MQTIITYKKECSQHFEMPLETCLRHITEAVSRRYFVKKVFLFFFILLRFISLLSIYFLTFLFIVRSNYKYVEEMITVSKVMVHLSKICSGDHPFNKYAKFSNKTNSFCTLLYTYTHVSVVSFCTKRVCTKCFWGCTK